MARTFQASFWLTLAIGLFVPVAEAQLIRNPFDACCNPCQTCQLPVQECACSQAHTQIQTRLQPVYETRNRTQQVLTYKDVAHTEYRQEAQLQTVPVTAYKSVTVDEGSYQQVWVPRLVTKQVPETTYQQRLSYKTVPYQTTRRVAQYETRTVPEQAVRYVPQQYQTAYHHQTVGCNTCEPTVGFLGLPRLPRLGLFAPPAPPAMAYYPQPVTTTTAVIPTMPTMAVSTQPTSVATRQPTPKPTPDPKFLTSPGDLGSADWSTIKSRRAAKPQVKTDRLGGYQVAPARTRISRSNVPSAARGKFTPAPSAATVFRSRQSTRIR